METKWRKIVNLFQGGDASQEIKQFQNLVSSCKDDNDIINCFNYYTDHFKNIKNNNDIKSTALENAICGFSKIFLPFFSKNYDSFENKVGGFNLLSIYISVNNIDKEALKELTSFLIILFQKDIDIPEGSQFIENSLQTKNILQKILSPKNISNTFLALFTAKPKEFTKTLIDNFPNVNYKSKDDFSTFYEKVITNIKSNSINDYYSAFNFIGILLKKNYNFDFISRFFSVSKRYFPSFKTYDFYLNYLQMGDDIEYKFLNDIVHDKNFDLSALNSIVKILSTSNNNYKLYFIDFNFFLKNIDSVDDEKRPDLFRMILQSSQTKQLDAFKTAFPPWKKKIDTEFFLNLTKSITNRHVNEITDIFLLDDENVSLDELFDQFENDPNVAEAADFVISNVNTKKVTPITIKLLNLSLKGSKASIEILKKLLPRSKVEWIVAPIVDLLKTNKLPDEIYDTLSEIAVRKSDFVSLFLNNGIEPLFATLDGFASIDFLAAIACNGPHFQIDEYIEKNFEKTVLKNLSDDNLKNLSLGLPHDSDSFGLLRIPSLVRHTTSIDLRTPFDRYIYGKVCTKAINYSDKPFQFDKKNMSFIRQYVPHGIDKKALLSDPNAFYHMVKGKMPFFNLYQLHFEMPHAVAEVKLKSTFGFWFFIKHIIGQTILFSTKTGAVSYDCDGIHAFNKTPIECTLKRWHFLVLVTQSKNFQLTNYASVYLDGKKIFDNFVQLSETLIIGSEDKNKAIWYIKDDFLISDDAFSPSDVQNAYLKGVHKRTATNYIKPEIICHPGFQFVKYKGIGAFLREIGSPEYIFLQMLKDSNTSKTFLIWMKCAFILLRKNEINLNFFNQSMKYVILKKSEFFTSECQEFALSTFNTSSYSSIFGDLQIISSPNICFDFLPRLFSLNYDFDDFFDQILDAYCVLELNDETRSYIEGGIVSYIKKTPSAIERIIFTVAALHKISDDEKYEIDKPSENPERMKKLIEIVTNDQEVYTKSIDFSTSLYFISVLPNDFSYIFIKYLAQVCLESPKYWEINALKQSIPFFVSLYKQEVAWCFFLALLTNKYFNTIDEYEKTVTVNIEVLKILLDMIASVIRVEIQNCNNMSPEQIQLLDSQLNQTDNLFSGSADAGDSTKESTKEEEEEEAADDVEKSEKTEIVPFDFDQQFISFKTLLLLRSISTDKQFLMCPLQIERLCSLGFDKLSFQDYPFQKTNKNSKNFEQPSIPISIDIDKTAVLSENLHATTIRYLRRKTHYDKLRKYERKRRISFAKIVGPSSNNTTTNRSNFKNVQMPEEIPKNIKLSDLFETKSVGMIVDLASKLLVSQAKNVFSNLRKLFAKYTIFGSDVHPGIACMMHNAISTYILENASQSKGSDVISSECANQFIGFLMNRVLEGLWPLNKLITLFNYAIKVIRSNTTSFKYFALITLSKVKSIDTRIDLLCSLFASEVFCGYLKNDQKYFIGLLHFVCTNEVSKSPKFDMLYETITKKSKYIPKTEFCKALVEKSQLIWFSYQPDQYTELMNDINKSMEQSSESLRQFRASFATAPVHPNYLETLKIRNIKNLILRRSLRFQIFYHLNEMNALSEAVLIKLFRREIEMNFIFNPPDKFMCVRGPQPFTVPQKMDPLVYSFTVPFKKTHRQIPLTRSKHTPNFKSILPEICQEKTAATCLKNWSLPPYCSTCAVLEVLESIWSTDTVIKCDLLSTPEVMPCVCSIGNDSLEMFLNSTIDESTGRIVLPESSDMLCHFEAFEVAACGFYGNTRGRSSSFFCNRSLISIKYSDVTLVVERRYAFQPRMVDVFTNAGNQYTIIFDTEKNKKTFAKKVKSKIKSISDANFGIGFAQRLLINMSLDQVTKLWTTGKMTTLDYLMYVNVSAGRSFNDTSQYPVFPWILGDFEKDEPSLARDLTKPMGAQNEARKERFVVTYKETNYHYGTHYSHSAAILHYMLRVEPFTFFSIHLHNGWDHKDRLFCNLSEAWKSASDTNQADVKELIPEFYAFPQIFENPNHLELGQRTDGLSLQVVTMPKWGTDTFKFVWQMRISLENADKINDWIDLIFGYKQRGEEAVKNVNVYQPLSYDDSLEKNTFGEVDLNAAIDMINNFGQCPAQLFKEPHPPRTTSPYGRRTLSTSSDPFFVTRLKNTSKYARNVRVLDKSIYVASDNELFVGTAGTAVKIRDDLHEIALNQQSISTPSVSSNVSSSASVSSGAIPTSNTTLSSFTFNASTNFTYIKQSKPVKEKLVCYCLSSDASMFAVASKYGMAVVKDCKEQIISKFVTMCNRPTAVALSSQHFILVVADSKVLHMFDVTTGFFIKKTEKGLFENDIICIQFDDVANLIIAADKTKVVVFGLDLRIIVMQQVSDPSSAKDHSQIPRISPHKDTENNTETKEETEIDKENKNENNESQNNNNKSQSNNNESQNKNENNELQNNNNNKSQSNNNESQNKNENNESQNNNNKSQSNNNESQNKNENESQNKNENESQNNNNNKSQSNNNESQNKNENESQNNNNNKSQSNNNESQNKNENELQNNNNNKSQSINNNELQNKNENNESQNKNDKSKEEGGGVVGNSKNKNETESTSDKDGTDSDTDDDGDESLSSSRTSEKLLHYAGLGSPEITCIAVCDSEIWCEEPFFICGRKDGVCEIWTLDVLSSEIIRTNLVKIKDPVIAVHIFSDNKAALVFGFSGSVTLVSMFNEKQCLVGKMFYVKCSICKSRDTSLSCCTRCGLYICSKCRAKRMPVVCTRCISHGIGEDTSEASIRRSSQLSDLAE